MSFTVQVKKDLEKYYKLGEKALSTAEELAIKSLNSDYAKALKSVKSDIADFMERYPDYDDMVAYKRLDKLRVEIARNIEAVTKAQVKKMPGFLGNSVTGGFNTSAYAMETSTIGNITFASFTDTPVALNKLNAYHKITWLDSTVENEAITIKRMNSVISQGTIEGESYSTIAKNMSKQFGYAQYRMERIARTEIGIAQSFGHKLAFDEAEKSNLTVSKGWIPVGGKRTRPNHEEMRTVKSQDVDGKIVFKFRTMNGNVIFVDGPHLTGTTDDINCRCRLITEFDNISTEMDEALEYNKISYEDFVARHSKTL